MMMTSMTPTSTGSQAPSNSFSVLAITKRVSTRMSGTISADRAQRAPAPQLPDHDEAENAGRPLRRRHRQHVGRGELARGAEHEDEQQHADQQQPVHARHVDLPGLGLRGVAHLHARQKAQLHGLAGDGVGAGDDRLAGDRRGHGGERHHRIERPVGKQQIERVGDGFGIAPAQRALAEIVEQQRRQHEIEPRGLDRLPAEMAEIVVERLGAGHHQEHRAERDQADDAVGEKEFDPVIGIERVEHAGVGGDLDGAGDGDDQEPDEW